MPNANLSPSKVAVPFGRCGQSGNHRDKLQVSAVLDERSRKVSESFMKEHVQQFASDNYAGVCPEAWAAMNEANAGHQTAYGNDIWTARAANAFRKLFETD